MALRIPLVRETNYLSDRVRRKDFIFPRLAEKMFDNPKSLKLLIEKVRTWIKISDDETVYAAAGYIYYLNSDFQKAKIFFAKAIEKNPDNLDNWLDLAFALYHTGKKEEKLAKAIIFNFDFFLKIYKKTKGRLTNKYLFSINAKISDLRENK